jgi:valyl-tRNA synthetase
MSQGPTIMEKTYSPELIEENCYQNWETNGYFEPQGTGPAFCVMLPPPNVTGSLHMGHGFQHTLIDASVRYNRMQNIPTLWQGGTDHAGISTQLVVEKQLEQRGIKRKDLSRDEFLEEVFAWKEQSGRRITEQMRRLGVSVDWSKERFTMDEGFSAAVSKVFIQLYEEGLIYRGTRLVNWDPKLGTAISDLEVVSAEEDGFMWYLRYPIADSEESLIVATTRPETMLGDTAVAVHPDDPRYQHFIGREIMLPLCDRLIPIIGDSTIDPEFGTGCVKITPAHDFNDYEIGKRHNLKFINIFNKKANINKSAPLKYQALDRGKARQEILKDLDALGLLIETKPHKLKIPRGEKSDVIIEPLLTDQWYVKMDNMAKAAVIAAANKDLEFLPETWAKTYFQWLENIEDWCISRQLWWGHRIPAWYDNHGRIYVGYSENDVRFKYKLAKNIQLQQDEDVLDTWFSSALWPFASLGWPKKTPELQQFYPTTVLFTGFDIIFFWVARMIMFGLKFTNQVPFKSIIITGLICDSFGKKMSKSKGNVLDPLDIIDGISLEKLLEKRTTGLMLESAKDKIIKATIKEFPAGINAYGTDALRFAFCAMATPTRIVRFDLKKVESCRNFCNKLWNASRFVLSSLSENMDTDFDDGAFQYSPADLWIQSRLQHTIELCHQHFSSYRFDFLASTLYDFVWHEYCDWYLELAKTVLYNEHALAPMLRGTHKTLIQVLDQILKLLHPLMPFITENIWQKIARFSTDNVESIMLAPMPSVDNKLKNPQIEKDFELVKKITQSLRNLRSEMNIATSKKLPLNIRTKNDAKIKPYSNILITLNKLACINFCDTETKIEKNISLIVDEVELMLPMSDLIDKQAELQRVDKELAKIQAEIDFAKNKLANKNFVKNAPENLVKEIQEKSQQAQENLQKLLLHKEKITSM